LGTVREYIYLPETEIAPTRDARTRVDRPLAVVNAVNTAAPVTWTVHVDHLNRPVRMTDAAKAAVWDAVWLPWGGVHSITGTATLDARFPGQWFQLETGLHYNWHRSYDPTIGRYTQPDPLGFVDGPSVYGYAVAAPQQAVDPKGLAAQACILSPAMCAAAAASAANMAINACRAAAAIVVAKAKPKECPPCVPPVGTQCYMKHVNQRRGHMDWETHYHTFRREQIPAGERACECVWKKNNGTKGTHELPPAGMAECSTYPDPPIYK
jgi:RHS repeat-associated protein